MATKKLSEGWTLSCGIWPPFLLPTPADVLSALREQGILKPEQAGLDALYEQWVFAQGWIYALEFDLPGEDERFSLRFEALSGTGEVRVNGHAVARFAPGELSVDVTGAVLDEGNRLEVAFDPALADGAPRGILGPVWLRSTSFLELRRVRAAQADGAIRVATDLTAHSAGRYLFKYTVSLDDEAVLESGVYERLRAADGAVEHALKLPSPACWDGEKYYTVRLEVERSGVGCDMARINIAAGAAKPLRVALVPAVKMRDRGTVRALRALGAQAVCPVKAAPRENALLEPDLLTDGLLIAEEQSPAEDPDLMALPAVRSLERLAGGERFWPPGAPVWRATKSPVPDAKAAEALYGANALGEAGRYARISRLVQAEAVRTRALSARRDNRVFAVRAAEDRPVYASDALIEHSGTERPAYQALRQAWRTCAAFDLGQPLSAEAPLPVWLFSDDAQRRPLTVTASVYALDGALIASTSFAALSGANAKLGELSAFLPEEGVVIARAELADGAKSSRIDQIVCLAKPGACPRGALMSPPRATLRVENGELLNAGPVAALGVKAGSFYGALLPGEKIALIEGIAAEDIESLNGQMA